jgi:hypothetical protein
MLFHFTEAMEDIKYKLPYLHKNKPKSTSSISPALFALLLKLIP